jgi:hypothetical protein
MRGENNYHDQTHTHGQLTVHYTLKEVRNDYWHHTNHQNHLASWHLKKKTRKYLSWIISIVCNCKRNSISTESRCNIFSLYRICGRTLHYQQCSFHNSTTENLCHWLIKPTHTYPKIILKKKTSMQLSLHFNKDMIFIVYTNQFIQTNLITYNSRVHCTNQFNWSGLYTVPPTSFTKTDYKITTFSNYTSQLQIYSNPLDQMWVRKCQPLG